MPRKSTKQQIVRENSSVLQCLGEDKRDTIRTGNVKADIHYANKVKVDQHVTFSSVTVIAIGRINT